MPARVIMARVIGRRGGSLVRQIDKAGLLCYKHNILAIEMLGWRCECP